MRRRKRVKGAIALFACALAAGGCGEDEASRPLEVATADALEAGASFLAGDLLEGRAPGTRGAELAAAYIVTRFQTAGLDPAADSGYLQPISLVAVRSEVQFSLRARGGASFIPTPGEELIAWSEDTTQVTEVDSDLVFAGFGIAAGEYGWDDYKDADVRGKVLLLLAGDPGAAVPGAFRGDTLTYYGFLEYKFEEAARRGASGAIIIHTEDLGYDWEVVASERDREQLWLEPDSGSRALTVEGWLSDDAAQQVVSMAGLDFGALLESARSDNFRPIPLGLAVSATVRNRVRRIADYNVAGLLRGGDEELADEVVIVSAHYDHLGIGSAVDSDSIYNGCYDNASGTALVLAVADAFTRMRQRPRRSVLFLAVTAQEPGLLGSRHYVANPLLPLANTVAVVSVDGVNLLGLTADVAALGAAESGLLAAVEAASAAEDLTPAGDPAPERGSLYGSDAFSFMRSGVPGTLIQHGRDYLGRMPGWGRQMLQQYY
ncbi:MAG TPA: M28 family peptidase, partial [Gemmatimonadota bacterium]|nr:M28 family peptidase [Gemmatimonadota bacterium]